MDFSQLFGSLQQSLGGSLPGVLGALGILVVGWIVALVLRGGTRKVLGFASVNERIGSETGRPMDVESVVAQGVFFVVLLMALLAAFNALDLALVSNPIQALMGQVFEFLPRLAAAGILALAAWIVATLLRNLARRGLAASGLDSRFETTGTRPVSESLSNVLYWLVFFLFLPAILGSLQIQGLLAPVQGMAQEFLAMLPNVFGALLIGVIGWLVAKVLRDLVTNLLAAAGADRAGEKAGLTGTMTISRLTGLLVYALVLIPTLIAALGALELDAIVTPATSMLSAVLAAIPNVLAAGLILAIAWFVARLVGDLIAKLLAGAGFDRVPAALGLDRAFQAPATLSRVVSNIFVFFVMLFAAVEASGRLGFTKMADIVAMFLEFGGQVLLGTVILGVGFWLANLAHQTILRVNGEDARAMANVARFTILGLITAMGLGAMGVAERIVQLAFGLTLGSVAVAVALAFGLGGREAAAKLLGKWVSPTSPPETKQQPFVRKSD